MKTTLLFILLVTVFYFSSCKNKRGCTDIRGLNYDETAEQDQGCRFMSDALAGNWSYKDTGSRQVKDHMGVWHATKYTDSGISLVTIRSIEQIRVTVDTQQYDLRVTHKPRLSYCMTTEYLIDTIYSENLFALRYAWHFEPNEKYSGRIWMKR